MGGAWSNRVRITPQNRDLFPVTSTATAARWPELTEAARPSQEPWVTTMEEAAPAVALIADLARSAGSRPDQEVMTRGHIDQKDLRLTAAGPVLSGGRRRHPGRTTRPGPVDDDRAGLGGLQRGAGHRPAAVQISL